MKINVIGKVARKGISKKNGKPYDNTVVFGTYDAYMVEGQACDSFWLNATEHPLESIEVGASYVVERTPKGYVTGFFRISE